jgi:hypothetical protein
MLVAFAVGVAAMLEMRPWRGMVLAYSSAKCGACEDIHCDAWVLSNPDGLCSSALAA